MITLEEQEARMVLYKAGKSDNDIAEARCICANAVSYWRSCQKPPLKANSDKLLQAKLDERESLLLQGVSVRKIAKLQGVSRGAIRSYIKNHLTICSEEDLS